MIKYQSIHTFTGADIANVMNDAGIRDVAFTCLTYRPQGWTDAIREFSQTNDIELAYKIIGDILLKIEQDDETHLIANPERVKELRDSIERQATGHGDGFITNLVYALFERQTVIEGRRLGNSKEPLPATENGNGKKREKSAEPA